VFAFILESIGTSELLLIGVIALIVFGPRKLPQLARMIGKTMAEFRNASQEFRSTWEKEVQVELEPAKNSPANSNVNLATIEETHARNILPETNTIPAPEIKKINEFQGDLFSKQPEPASPEEIPDDKKNWI